MYGSTIKDDEAGGGAPSGRRSGSEGDGVEAGRALPQDKLPLIWKSEQDTTQRHNANGNGAKEGDHDAKERHYNIFHYLVYALINVIIAVPGLYGYASVIFNHPAFQPQMASLSKLVVFSSLVHQLGFSMFSSLNFAIGTVQDAGLIFLSVMSNSIAESILDEGGTIEEVVSTTLVILPLGTAALGLVLILLGKFRMLDIVSYLPMPVIGGYLAFIGYFCLEAGVALCIGKSMTTISDWRYLLDPHLLLLATPGLLSAGLLTIISRKATNDALLPLAMVIIPATFYAILFVSGVSLDEARDNGWVGEVSPPVPVRDILQLVDFNLVRWGLVSNCIGTWVGMVFVVSFASCLDIAAISMDMGEALDTNKEMVTVGVSNLMSGLLFGFSGSYIFSQTIFTYRTGCHSRYIGVFIMVAYLIVCVSTVNLLQIAPLFFLGATLIFIGYDLLWEWLIDIRVKVFFMEYMILLVTFVAIQIVGMDFGIVIGVVVALIEHVASTTRVSSLGRVMKRSRAVWSNDDWDTLQTYGYNSEDPKIVTLEVKGPIFFGSSQKLLSDVTDEIGLAISEAEMKRIAFASPHTSTPMSSLRAHRGKSPLGVKKKAKLLAKQGSRPQFVVLDFSQMHNLDASAATSCFLQLAKMCEKRGILLCAAGAIPQVEWMLRSHDVVYGYDEEIQIKNDMLNPNTKSNLKHGKLILFLTIFEALEFCERLLIERMTTKMPYERISCLQRGLSNVSAGFPHHQLTYIFLNVLRGDLSEEEKGTMGGIQSYYEEEEYQRGQSIFKKNTLSDSFYVVVQGAVAVPQDKEGNVSSAMIRSGAGAVESRKSLSSSNLLQMIGDEGQPKSVESFHKVGGIFGYCDFLLERYRSFDAVAASDNGAMVAVFTKANLNKMKTENAPLYLIVQKLLLRASIGDLANCTCHN